MKKLRSFLSNVVFLLLFSCVLLNIGCEKDNSKNNKLPTCKIDYPIDEQIIKKGDTVSISVEANDLDGSIAEAQIFIDDELLISLDSLPFKYYWNTITTDIGNHIIKAICIDNDQGSMSDEINIKISQNGYNPICNFRVNLTSGIPPLTLNFTDYSSGIPTSWEWDFGDGGISYEQHPIYTYTEVGVYNVSLKVTNEIGSDILIKNDYIIAFKNKPHANFSSDFTKGNAPLTINFTDLSINYPTSWFWDFGDGSTSEDKNPSHIYDADRTYNVSLTVLNELGSDTKIIYKYIYVGVGGEPCPGLPTITYAGKLYNTVMIGEQCWLKENLDVGQMIRVDEDQTDNGIMEKYCYNNDTTLCDAYGGFYQWEEMMKYNIIEGGQGICPDGWHIPTDDDWKILEGAVDSQYGIGDSIWDGLGFNGYDAGKNLKSTSGWWPPIWAGVDKFGFRVLPSGFRRFEGGGNFYGLKRVTHCWTSTIYTIAGNAYTRAFNGPDFADRAAGCFKNGLSVRCVKN